MLRYCFNCRTAHPVQTGCPNRKPWGGRKATALRDQVMRRDHWRCRECGAPADHADHIVPRAMGGTDTLDNLQALCADCNLAKGNS